MKIGIFTDTYFPQVSGVATSIKTLKEELLAQGHEVYIFTTSDPLVKKEDRVIRFASIPLLSFKERRIAVSGLGASVKQARELELDMIHTQTEFGMGWLGKRTARKLGIPVIHTYHTMYEDYLHYIVDGKLLKPKHVRWLSRKFTKGMNGIVCPSQRVVDKLQEYDIQLPMEIIPTGINLKQLSQTTDDSHDLLREHYQVAADDILLLSLSRLSFEKNIQATVAAMPEIIATLPKTKLMIVGSGPYADDLKQQVADLDLTDHVIFTGEVNNQLVGEFYRAADLFVNTSTSESQGLTYIEALAAGAKVVAPNGPYLAGLIDDPSLGRLFDNVEEFGSVVCQYLAELSTNADLSKEEIRQTKLADISSQRFVEKVSAFYQVAEANYQKEVVATRQKA
ncbi:glycosyltransferase family 4 protein [Vagococcus coleopterorum]|uniref:Glycosyltransferase family 4 protein n=1 Tax=Vagococcus coleopterorum TaxID=2714946 RepID=A0A6G8AKW2_9ENTE|nr:glycosyltransferase family 4 protein [Vagococcus coleopterorum]QIL45627.1 glycosyltransferase family 4 protein [Vagococcus coleopterorum]